MADRKAVIAALRRHTEQQVGALALNLTANLIEATPVDTGFARANWIPSLSEPELSGSGQGQAEGQAAVAAYKLEQGSVFVSNGAAYIQRLNQGHSKQAPAGYVEREIDRALTEARAGMASP